MKKKDRMPGLPVSKSRLNAMCEAGKILLDAARPSFPTYIDSSAARRELESAVGWNTLGGHVDFTSLMQEPSEIQHLLLAEIRRLKEEKRKLEGIVRNYLKVFEAERFNQV